jgi:hypothetical protein
MAEPGAEGFDGRYAAFCNIDEDCEDNVIFGHGNTGHASIIANDANLVSDHAEIKAPKIIAKELEATTIVGTIAGNFSVQSGNEFREVFIKSFTPTNPTQFQDVIRFTSELGASVFMVELSVVSANANTSNSAAVKYIISGKTDSANNATALATVIGGNEAIECNLVISGADVTIQLKPSYYLHGRLIVNADVRSSGDMTVTKL